MRVKRIDKAPHIVLSLTEAKKLKEALDDYTVMCNTCGYTEDRESLEKLVTQFDDALLRAEAL